MSIRKLNLVMTYPVKWSRWQMMNNFVQNFYDALGMERFHQEFEMSYHDHVLTMSSNEVFSIDWLYYMGTSSKRDGKKLTAGHFGEGFKIAALTAYRDFGMGVQMESMDWRLVVTDTTHMIDGKESRMLAYDVGKKPYEQHTKLTLTGATDEDFLNLQSQRNQFYYDENPQFGRCIAKGENYAVFEARRKEEEKHCSGGIYINMEERGIIGLPVYFCIHHFHIPQDDRERWSLPVRTRREAIEKTISYLNAKEAMEVLEIISPVWYTCYERRYYRAICWWNILRDLTDIIRQDSAVHHRFLEKYKKLLIVECDYKWVSKHRKAMAYEWLRQSEFSGRRRVASAFMRTGLDNILDLCSEHGGFDETAEPDQMEKRKIQVLEEVAETFFSELYCYDTLPECKVILNNKSPLLGKARTEKTREKRKNHIGLPVASRIDTVYLQRYLLKKESFLEALPVYLHELLHQFGGDNSLRFRAALMEMNRIMILHRKEIIPYEQKWRNTENDKTGSGSGLPD